MKTVWRIFAGGLVWLCLAALQAQTAYTVTDLGTLGGTNSTANGLNASGQVTGLADLPDDQQPNAFVTGANGQLPLRNLGTLGGLISYGEAITADGRVAGISALAGESSFHAFLSAAGGDSLKDLGTLGGANSYVYSVNGSGQAAGYSTLANGSLHAALSGADGGPLIDLGTLPGGVSSFAFAVNASGQVAGYSGTASGFNHAFIRDVDGTMRDLGTLGGRVSFGAAINDNGQVVGRSEANGAGQHAFRSGPNGGALFDLGTLGGFSSSAQGINNGGTTVGSSYLSDNSTVHAFVYSTANGMRDLNALIPAASGWTLTSARSINARGQIAGEGLLAGNTRAFLITPVPPNIYITGIVRLSNGQIRVQGVGAPSQSHTVEVTTDLKDKFTTYATIMASSDGSLNFDDAMLSGVSRRFYRFVYP